MKDSFNDFSFPTGTSGIWEWCRKNKITTSEPWNKDTGRYDRLIIHFNSLKQQVIFEAKYTSLLKRLIKLQEDQENVSGSEENGLKIK